MLVGSSCCLHGSMHAGKEDTIDQVENCAQSNDVPCVA